MQKGSPREAGQTQVLILAGIVLLIALAGGIFFLGRVTLPRQDSSGQAAPKPQPQNVVPSSPQPSPTPDETVYTESDRSANWKTYTNTKYGYSFKYPLDVLLEEKPGGFVFIDKQIYVAVTNSDPEQCRGDCPVIEKKEEVIINGVSSKRLTGYIGAVGGSIPQSYQTIVIPKGDQFYNFTVYELKYDDIQPPNRKIGLVPEEKLELLNQILSTFKFTD